MTAWTLIIIFAAGYNSAAPVVISDIASYEECDRLMRVIVTAPSLTQGKAMATDLNIGTRVLCAPYKKAQ
jgi:hypothetical protein